MDETKQTKQPKPSRPRGTGSIYRQPGAATYTIQYYAGGRRVREATGTDDLKEAQQKLNQRLAAVGEGQRIVINRKMTVQELYLAVERDYKTQKHRSLEALQLRWKHLKPFFGNIQATAVNKDMINTYIDARLLAGASNASINRELACLKRAFSLAKERILPPAWPAKLKEANIRLGFVEDQQFAKLVEHAPELWLRTFLEIAYNLGWRKSEILNLRVRQVDVRHRPGTIRLDVGTTKTGEAREAPIFTTKMRELLIACMTDKGPDDHVLTRKKNQPVLDFRRRWEKLCDAAGLPDLIVHDFRRSAARNLRAAGIAESVAMKIVGWESAEMFRHYGIVDNKDKFVAMEQLEKYRSQEQVGHKVGHSRPDETQNEATAPAAWTN
jgi:integrase